MDGNHNILHEKGVSMLPLLKQIYHQIRKNIYALRQTMANLFRLAKDGQLAWLLYFARYRARYGLNALHAGMVMNRIGQGDVYNFRRSIHRIEKGLLQKQLKTVFAEDYILETVHYLMRLRTSDACDKNTIAWGEAVLGQYFRVCQHAGRVAVAYKLYQDIEIENGQLALYPYPADTRPALSVRYDDLHQLALRRRSIRYYLDKNVEFETVQQAMAVAALSPSACNRQAFKFLFYNEKNIVDEILKIPGGYVGFDAPSVVIVAGSYRGYFHERDANVPIIDASLAVMAFILALETLGLSSVCVNWPCLPDQDEVIRRLIHLEEDEFITILIVVGYAEPQGKVPYSAKRDINTLVFCNERIIGKPSPVDSSGG